MYIYDFIATIYRGESNGSGVLRLGRERRKGFFFMDPDLGLFVFDSDHVFGRLERVCVPVLGWG